MSTGKKRILIIDDSEAIHRDFRRILCPEENTANEEIDVMADELFGSTPAPSTSQFSTMFDVDSAFQGRDGLAKVEEAQAAGQGYTLVFLDYRMPPGWNGIETLRRLRKVAPTLQVVLCSAYSDYSWEELVREFGEEPPLELRKPFNSQELHQLVIRLTRSA
jgi:CheY-like chemotaxis protein